MASVFIHNKFYPQNFLIDSMSEADLDELIEMICAEAINVSPDSFNGESRCFKFNLRYCPPYEQDRFRELKRLQEVAQSNVRFKDEFKGFVALDITEWNGHFDEDLFKITLAFLSDMSDCWKYIFILSGYLKDNLDMLNKYFKINEKELREELEPVNDIYNLDNIEYFMDDPKCANCGKDATSRCMRCKSEWYCSRECQVKRWKMHKPLCQTLSKLYEEEKEEKKKSKKIKKSKKNKLFIF